MLDTSLYSILDKMDQDYENYTYFTLKCPDLDTASQFVIDLQLVEVGPYHVCCADHISITMVHGFSEKETQLIIGGDLSVEEITDILRQAQKKRYTMEKGAVGESASQRLTLAISNLHHQMPDGFFSKVWYFINQLLNKLKEQSKNMINRPLIMR